MTAVEKALREVIATKDEVIAAKEQTIAALTAVVDLYRTGAVGAPVSVPEWPAAHRDEQQFEVSKIERMWLDDAEEDLAAMIESGEIQGAAAEQALAAIQATQTPIALAK